MSKESVYKFLYLVSIFLIVAFLFVLYRDYLQYNPIVNSAPFYVFVLVRCAEFILPSVIVFVVARFLKNRLNKY